MASPAQIKTPLTMSTAELFESLERRARTLTETCASISDRLEAVADALEREGFGPPPPELALVREVSASTVSTDDAD